jgi:hypothetical protein
MKQTHENPTAYVRYENHRQAIDYETGEILTSISETRSTIPREPKYVKLYLADITYLNSLPKSISGVLYELLQYMDYQGRIILNAGLKREIAARINTSVQHIENSLTKFSKKEILIRKDTGIYLANPWLFGRGSWEDVRAIRLTVEYNLDGTRNLQAELQRVSVETE